MKKIFLIHIIILLLSFCSAIILANTNEHPTTFNITIDVNNVLSNNLNNPVGINLNFLRDNTEITNPLREIKAETLRYPMGEIGDNYLFDKDNPAKPKISMLDFNFYYSHNFNANNRTWKNPLSFDDFMSICKSVSCEPFIVIGIDAIAYTGNAPHATPEEVLEAAVAWVRYANIIKGYNVKHWEIGNENYLHNGGENHKYWTAEKYARTVVKFSRAMKAVDPSIKIGANGTGHLDWWDRVMPIVKDDVDFLVSHQYSWVKDYQEWKNGAYSYDHNIKAASKAINSYNPNLKINVTEISSYSPRNNFHGNNTWKMLHNFEVLGNALLYNQVEYLHFWISKWMNKNSDTKAFSAFDTNYQLIPMGYPLKIWNDFLEKQMVYSSVEEVGTIRSWASYDPDDDSLNIFVLNKDNVSQDVTIELNNYEASIQNEQWILKGSTPESTDIIWENSGSALVNGSKVKTKLDPLSVTVIALQDQDHADE